MTFTQIKLKKETHRTLKVRAAEKGMTYTQLLEYLLKLDKQKTKN